MRILIILIFSHALLKPAAAQGDKAYRENSLDPDSSQLVRSVYQYRQFQRGDVAFKSHATVQASLNYNYLSGQMLFISDNGDTLELARPETLQYVAVGADTFYYVEKGYAEALTHLPAINLYKKQVIKYNGTEKKGAYGTYSGTSSSSSLNTYSNENVTQRIGVDENLLYVTSRRYYLSDRFYNFLPASKKNFYRLFSSREKILTDYLKDHPVHYTNEGELLNLLQYLQAN
jgi:hypothetical protein